MSDSSQTCPPAWREYTTPVRSCGRPETNTPLCASSVYNANGTGYYRKVCGRVISYQHGATEGFGTTTQPVSIESQYVDGISVTHGNPRAHIWTFAVGQTDGAANKWSCPCGNPNAPQTPQFVGNNYFCESGTTSGSPSRGTFYSNDPLWDGEGCVRNQCECTFNSPPWFKVQLPSSTTDDIEVRICGATDTNNEDMPIELIEIYVQ